MYRPTCSTWACKIYERNGLSMTRTNNLEFGKQKSAVETTFIKFDDLNAERKDADWHKCPGTWASLGIGHVKCTREIVFPWL